MSDRKGGAPLAPTEGKDAGGISSKGLSAGTIGLLGAVVIGISCIAPAYTFTAAIGPTASVVGAQIPAIILIGFIPMLLVAFGYRELNRRMPDAGTSFTWATRAFGPWVGWLAGWGLIVATILVLSNLTSQRTANQIFPFVMLPQFFLAGVFNPIHALPPVLAVLSALSPMRWAVEAVRHVYYATQPGLVPPELTPVPVVVAVIAVSFVGFIAVGTALFVRAERNR